MEYKDILVEVKEKIATIRLNRPEVGNAWGQDTSGELADAIAACATEDGVSAVVITGNGKHFCAGGDINRFKQQIEAKKYLELPNILRAGELALGIRKCPKPVIAMINGAAAGAGCSIALACDFRVMTPKSKLVMAFINIGLSGDTCGLYCLQKLAGTALATELMMTGRLLGGEEAKILGLTTILAEEGQLEEAAYVLARKLVDGPACALSRQKDLINRYFYGDMEDYIQTEARYMQECSQTADFAEAVYAFLDKRTPLFHGK